MGNVPSNILSLMLKKHMLTRKAFLFIKEEKKGMAIERKKASSVTTHMSYPITKSCLFGIELILMWNGAIRLVL